MQRFIIEYKTSITVIQSRGTHDTYHTAEWFPRF